MNKFFEKDANKLSLRNVFKILLTLFVFIPSLYLSILMTLFITVPHYQGEYYLNNTEMKFYAIPLTIITIYLIRFMKKISK